VTAPVGLAFRGNPDDLRVTATGVGHQARGCPARLWADSRPGIRPDLTDWWWRREPWPFLLGRVADAVTVADRTGEPPDVDLAGLHPGVAAFVRHAVDSYLEASAGRRTELGVDLAPADDRVIDTPGRELRGWALGYDSPDRSVREVRRLRLRSVAESAGGRPDAADDLAWAAVAAKLAVDGRRTGGAGPDPEPARVLIVEIGLADGSSRVVFDGDSAAARRSYDNLARPRITAAMSDVRFRPGRDCAGCRWVAACPALPRVRGLLGLPGHGVMTRSVSASDLDQYARCPARYFLSRVAHLPAEPVELAGPARGLAAHQWLAAQHSRPGAAACTPAELPDDRLDLAILEARPYLENHIGQCPLGFDGLESVVAEPPIYVYDPDADVVVAASPDLTFTTGNGPVWRETKTTAAAPPIDERDALDAYPAVALDIVLLAETSRGIGGEPVGLVELEILTPQSGVVHVYDVADPVTLAVARRQVGEAAYAWHTDLEFTARPGSGCPHCPVRRWCPHGTV